MGKLLSKITQRMITSFMEKQLRKSNLVEDFSGELHPGKITRVPLPGSTNAGSGETFAYVRRGTTRHLLVIFMGGGLSWNKETAKHAINPESATKPGTPALYSPAVNTMTEFSTFALYKTPGLLSSNPENLFADWNLLVINYVTGDFHVGRNDYSYTDSKGERRVLHHQGYGNFEKAMACCKRFFPEADKLLVVGSSAGAFAVPALTPDIMNYYPTCDDVTVFSDSNLLLMDQFRQVAGNVWCAEPSLVEAIHSNDISADWYERLYSIKGDAIRYLYANSYQDYLLSTFQNYIDNTCYRVTDELCRKFTRDLKGHVDRLRLACPNMGFYISDHKPIQPKSPGTEHCMILNQNIINKANAPVSGMQWLYDAVNGKLYDVGMELLDSPK